MKLLTFAEAQAAIRSKIAVIIIEIDTRERLTDEATLQDLEAIAAEERQNEVRLYANI